MEKPAVKLNIGTGEGKKEEMKENKE